MPNVLVSTKGMSKAEWLEWRKKGIGGSDASIVCGLNRFKSPVELFMEKTGQIESKVAGEAAHWGTMLEPIIRNEFTQRTGLQIKQEHAILQHAEHPFMLANLDGIIADPINGDCVFEAKTAGAFMANDWVDHVPQAYQLQVQHYLAVTNLSGAYIAVLIGGNKFMWHYLARDNDLIAMLIELEKRFWHNVETMIPPAMDGSDASSELLSRLYPTANTKTQITLPDALPLISQYDVASEQEKAAAERKDEAVNMLKALLGENEIGVAGDRIITWKNISSERLDSKILKVEQPEIYSKYLSRNSYRRFSIK